MKLVFRSHTNTPEEIQLGHKLGFTTIRGIDAISASANLNGFTPATAVLRHLGYDKDQFQEMARSHLSKIFAQNWDFAKSVHQPLVARFPKSWRMS